MISLRLCVCLVWLGAALGYLIAALADDMGVPWLALVVDVLIISVVIAGIHFDIRAQGHEHEV